MAKAICNESPATVVGVLGTGLITAAAKLAGATADTGQKQPPPQPPLNTRPNHIVIRPHPQADVHIDNAARALEDAARQAAIPDTTGGPSPPVQGLRVSLRHCLRRAAASNQGTTSRATSSGDPLPFPGDDDVAPASSARTSCSCTCNSPVYSGHGWVMHENVTAVRDVARDGRWMLRSPSLVGDALDLVVEAAGRPTEMLSFSVDERWVRRKSRCPCKYWKHW